MNKIKKFWNDHKVIIYVIGGTIVVATLAYFLLKKKYPMVDLTGKNVICWKPENDKCMNLEKVKEFLDANKDSSAQLAIFREGPNPDEYIGIVMDDNFIIPGES
jgi:hypothetical protein